MAGAREAMARPWRALVVIPSFEGGGAERAWATLLGRFPPERGRVEVVRFRPGGVFEEDLPATTVRHALPVGRVDPVGILRLAGLMRRLRPDVAIGVLRLAGVLTLLAAGLARTGTRVIVNEQNVPGVEMGTRRGAGVRRRILSALYPRAAAVAVLSRGIGASVVRESGVPPARVRVIPNPVDLDLIERRATEPPAHPWLAPGSGPPVVVAAGRLVAQKGFDVLLRAFARVRREAAVRLIVLGAGPLEGDLLALRERLDLTGQVDFPGFVRNPWAAFRRAACLAVSSRYEGFGNVIVEAMACGTPVVSTRCPSGPEDIITDARDGLLVAVDDPGALADGLLRVVRDHDLAGRLAREGRRRAADFAAPRVAGAWLDLIEAVAAPRAPGRA